MYYTKLNPITGQPVSVPSRLRERRLQKALLMYDDPNNYHDIKSALKETGCEDLIGTGEDCLIAPYPPKSLSMRRSSRVKRLEKQNEEGKKQKTERREMFAEKMRQEDLERLQKKRKEREAKRRQTADGRWQQKSDGRQPADKMGDRRSGGRKPLDKMGDRKSGGRKPAGIGRGKFAKGPKKATTRKGGGGGFKKAPSKNQGRKRI